tara:strand:+ start:1971 stop:3347 length:1377 start_codon:yes stop_codon:yes gene_type:complete
MLEDVIAHYVSVFDADSLYGYRQIISIFSGIVLIWMCGISFLIIKANPRGFENRFMAVLLIFEAQKATVLFWDFFPNGPKFEWLWDYLWWMKYDVYMFAIITSVMLYLSFPVYYKVNRFQFLYSEALQKRLWYVIPIVGLLIWVLIRGQEGIEIANGAWIVCEGVNSPPVLQSWFGDITEVMLQIKSDMGTCPSAFEALITDEHPTLWLIGFTQVPAGIFALILFRSAMIESKSTDRNDTLTNRSLYIGFLGKLLISMVYAFLLVVIFPLLNGGEMLTFSDNLALQFGDEQTTLDRMTFFLWTSSLAILPLAISFEALMFVHASLKESVFGIDKKLRATFTTAVFTSLGVVSFVIGSEIMENLIGFGIMGGVMVGIGVVVVRKPVISLIDGVSGRILPSEFSDVENKYLDAYIKTLKDGVISDDERRLLLMLANSYNLQDERVKYIEMSYISSIDQEE